MIKASFFSWAIILGSSVLCSAQKLMPVVPHEEPADPKLAATMTLEQAKAEIQHWRQWDPHFGDPDIIRTVLEFSPDHWAEIEIRTDGEKKYVGCPYDSFEPAIWKGHKVYYFEGDRHKGEKRYQVTSHPRNARGCLDLWVDVPDLDEARKVSAALLRWKMATPEERANFSADVLKAFAPVAEKYRVQNPRPEAPEDVRRFRVMAEGAVADKRFSDAVSAYEDALAIAPWWPAGQFNAALVLGELGYYDEAILHMQKYLALVPEASDARAARDRIYQWEGAQKVQGLHDPAPPAGGKK